MQKCDLKYFLWSNAVKLGAQLRGPRINDLIFLCSGSRNSLGTTALDKTKMRYEAISSNHLHDFAGCREHDSITVFNQTNPQ